LISLLDISGTEGLCAEPQIGLLTVFLPIPF
jgi:hypothetical protein